MQRSKNWDLQGKDEKTESTSLQTFETFIGQEAESKTSGTLQTFETSMLTLFELFEVAIQLVDFLYCIARMPSDFEGHRHQGSRNASNSMLELGTNSFGIPSFAPLSQLPKVRESVSVPLQCG